MEKQKELKICIWGSGLNHTGGIARIVSVLANGLDDKADIVIFSDDYEEQFSCIVGGKHFYRTPRELDIVQNIGFASKTFRKINERTGKLNSDSALCLLEKAYIPQPFLDSIVGFFKKNSFDVIIGVDGEYSLYLAAVSSFLTAKTIGWQHSCFEAYFVYPGKYYSNRSLLYKKYLKELTDYVVLNEVDKEKVDNAFKIESTVIYNSKPFTSDKSCDVEEKTFLSVGRFCEVKAYDVLIDSFRAFHDRFPEWKLIMVGDGETKKQIEDMVVLYDIGSSVEFAGLQSNVEEYYLQASAFLLSSHWEGMPMVILEALEMGCPIISFDISAIEPLVTDGVEGIVVPKKEGVIGFSNAMMNMAGSVEKRRYYSEMAKAKAKMFTEEMFLNKWRKLLWEAR